MTNNIVLLDTYTDQQLIDIAAGCNSKTQFANKLGYKSTSSLNKLGKSRLNALGILFTSAFTRYRVTDESIVENAPKCNSITSLMIACGLKPHGYAHCRFKARCVKLGITFKPQSWNKGKRQQKVDINEYLENRKPIQPSSLRRRLIKAGLMEYKCLECGLSEWRGQPLKLHLDHIDGNRENNRLENLRILCPNCHSQTPTYAMIKNRAGVIRTHTAKSPGRFKRPLSTFPARPHKPIIRKNNCINCGEPIPDSNKYCSSKCSHKLQEKIHWPENLAELAKNQSILSLAKILGVSDNAIRKRLRRDSVS